MKANLMVSYDNENLGGTGLIVSKYENEKYSILKMELDEQADLIYKLLTNQMVKIKELGDECNDQQRSF